MQAQIKLGRVFGVKIGLHYTWLIIAFLVTVSLASHFHSTNAEWGGVVIWTSAVITGVLFFASIIAHELAHATVARSRGLPVRSITLFAFGGVAQIEREPADAKTEFRVGIAGPVTSVIIGAMCLVLAYIGGWKPMSAHYSPVLAMLTWLGYINIMLALFNMIPGFPLDGGRVLKAAIWWVTADAHRATRIASRIGKFVACGFIALGVVQFASGAGIGGLWIALIGWFLLDAARATSARDEMDLKLSGFRVRDVMSTDCPPVDGNLNLQTFVDQHLLRSGVSCYIVLSNGTPAGVITPQEVRTVDRLRWPYTTVYDVMLPMDPQHAASPETSISDALRWMSNGDTTKLPVMADGRFVGIITRDHVLRFLQTRSELGL
ncbi:MAG TPA: site-2 protease family protein [Blastocatellia bacterium]|nr:site-2 protease family protein [Blastocatellia bacterium]